jgi:ribosomal protein L11 methyltransferase
MIEPEQKAKRVLTDIKTIREAVLETVCKSKNKLTPAELEKRLIQNLGTRKTAIKTAIRKLVDDRELIYSYHYGCSFLEQSFNKPTRVSHRVVIKPPDTKYRPESDEVVINIQPGVSFGSGEHPTTRLALRSLEHALFNSKFFRGQKDLPALDIGTGSGVLALAAAKLGVKRVVGVDVDPCARAEAQQNVQLNNLERRIEILSQRVETMDQQFGLITANLRYPTLKRLSPCIAQLSAIGAAFVVSGLKTDEEPDLVSVYSQNRLKCVWKAYEKDWVGLVFERSS